MARLFGSSVCSSRPVVIWRPSRIRFSSSYGLDALGAIDRAKKGGRAHSPPGRVDGVGAPPSSRGPFASRSAPALLAPWLAVARLRRSLPRSLGTIAGGRSRSVGRGSGVVCVGARQRVALVGLGAGCQSGQPSSPFVSVRGFCPVPSAFIVQRSAFPVRAVTKTILLPSGDHAQFPSCEGSLVVRSTLREPSAFITQTSAFP